jgi:hypothetical protein
VGSTTNGPSNGIGSMQKRYEHGNDGKIGADEDDEDHDPDEEDDEYIDD